MAKSIENYNEIPQQQESEADRYAIEQRIQAVEQAEQQLLSTTHQSPSKMATAPEGVPSILNWEISQDGTYTRMKWNNME